PHSQRVASSAPLPPVPAQPVPPIPARGRSAAVIGGRLERDPRRRLLPEQALALLKAPESGPGTSVPQTSGAPFGATKASAPTRRGLRGLLLAGAAKIGRAHV